MPPRRLAVSPPVPIKEKTMLTIAIKNNDIAQFKILAGFDFIDGALRRSNGRIHD
jgi:hypothetical protein